MKTLRFSPAAWGPLSLFAGLVLATALLSGCSYFYTTTLQGYVKDAETDAGVNGATVYFYNEDPGSASAAASNPSGPSGFITGTTTSTSNSNDGYFSATVIWNNPFGKFGDEGDTTTIWAVVVHDDYTIQKKKLLGIFSEGSNTVPDIMITSNVHTCPELTGRVEDSGGNGVNGIRLALDLTPDDGVDDQDYLVTTQTIDGTGGSFSFTDIQWEGTASTDISHEVLIRVDDSNYQEADASASVWRQDLAEDSSATVNDPFPVVRQPRDYFSTTLSGQVYQRYQLSSDVSDVGKGGVSLTFSWLNETDDAGGTEAKSTTVTTSSDGTFQVTISWYDYGTPKDSPSGTDLPEGEDELELTSIVIKTLSSSLTWEVNGVTLVPASGTITTDSDGVNLYVRSWTSNYLDCKGE